MRMIEMTVLFMRRSAARRAQFGGVEVTHRGLAHARADPDVDEGGWQEKKDDGEAGAGEVDAVERSRP